MADPPVDIVVAERTFDGASSESRTPQSPDPAHPACRPGDRHFAPRCRLHPRLEPSALRRRRAARVVSIRSSRTPAPRPRRPGERLSSYGRYSIGLSTTGEGGTYRSYDTIWEGKAARDPLPGEEDDGKAVRPPIA
jgi:hypothetical protein